MAFVGVDSDDAAPAARRFLASMPFMYATIAALRADIARAAA